VGVAIAAACGTVDEAGELRDNAPEAEARVIDEDEGSYRGLPLGATVAQMQRTFGRRPPADLNEEAVIPLRAEAEDLYTSPVVVRLGGDSPVASRDRWYRYDGLAFGFWEGELRYVETIEAGAATRRGVAIGDSLAEARKAYPRLRCGTTDYL
jgi:hypothetical protein